MCSILSHCLNTMSIDTTVCDCLVFGSLRKAYFDAQPGSVRELQTLGSVPVMPKSLNDCN
jgi:hypothetical protein